MPEPSSFFHDAVRHPELGLLLDVDASFGAGADGASYDRPIRRLFAGLHRTGVRVAIVSGRARPRADKPGASPLGWRTARDEADRRTAADWARRELGAGRIVAIGDHAAADHLFSGLGADDLAIGLGAARDHARFALPGPTAVRAFMRWVIDARVAGEARPFPALEHARP